MLLKVYLTLLFVAGLSSLECVFEVQAGATRLDVEGGVDKCESSDQYCAVLNYNGIYAKGCSKTAEKITGVGMPAHITCTEEKCNEDNSLCCCKKDRCNSAIGMSIVTSLLSMIAAGLFVKN